ncbi:eukaryotic translation initiation factor 3 subunit K-like [Watersipora subatra]|uniref:eukaryotic translation initiation factor 3 subunit K-like n=1 Tax=Watersipora subatra TaxID=2589382 RepID=UPI00355C9807
MAETMRATVASLLKGIDRYNPENLDTLERYVAIQAEENTYDLEANLAVLKLYQFNPTYYNNSVTIQILLKALTNLPHADLNLCKSLLDSSRLDDPRVGKVIELADMLETCQFAFFWTSLEEESDLVETIVGFTDSIRKFVCHVWISKYGWTENGSSVYIANQEDFVKTRKVTEKIDFDSIADIMVANA